MKYYGQSPHMLDHPAVFTNPALSGTSAWANNFLGRDHAHAAVPGNGTPRPDAVVPSAKANGVSPQAHAEKQ
jgi:hypothetical protein